ncbi:hypothetical protein C8F04DRAFT_1196489 [Mycena alexandri]|uniref:Uncharacterized protein n=1 Tax=Mycena alexandri TaxID=1745969 RepID=A0AAD6S7J4_9AGAR|nr:hypothetical protein C8F04DRAFT_1196489 [Mycena alexandri]
MPAGRLPLDPRVKAERRQATLQRYALNGGSLPYRPSYGTHKGLGNEPSLWMKLQEAPLTETKIYGVHGAPARQILGNARPTAPHRPRPATVSNAERRRKKLEVGVEEAPPPFNVDDCRGGETGRLRPWMQTNAIQTISSPPLDVSPTPRVFSHPWLGWRGITPRGPDQGASPSTTRTQATPTAFWSTGTTPPLASMELCKAVFVGCTARDLQLQLINLTPREQVEPLIRGRTDAVYFQAHDWCEASEKWEQHCEKNHDHLPEWRRSSSPSPASSAFTVSRHPSRESSPCSFFGEPTPSPSKTLVRSSSRSATSTPHPSCVAHQNSSGKRRGDNCYTPPSETCSLDTAFSHQGPRAPRSFLSSELPYPPRLKDEIEANLAAAAAALSLLPSSPERPAPELTHSARPSSPERPALELTHSGPRVDIPLVHLNDSDSDSMNASDLGTTELGDLSDEGAPPQYDPTGSSAHDWITVESSPPPRLVYAVSGHEIVFRDRDAAWKIFQARRWRSMGVEFLMATTPEELRCFIGRHGLELGELVFALSCDPHPFELLKAGETQAGEMLVTKDVRRVESFYARQ